MLWCRFQQCLGMSAMLLVKGSPETVLFRYLSDYIFWGHNFGNNKRMRVIFFSKCLKINVDFKNLSESEKKNFFFWHKCIWNGIVQLSLLRTGYFSSAGNALTSRHNILHVNKRDIFQLNWLTRIKELEKIAVIQISTVLGQVCCFACRTVLWNWRF